MSQKSRAKTMKNSKKSTQDKQPAVTGMDLLVALEPMMMEHAHVAKDKRYAAWVLACLRREIESGKSPTPSVGYGQTMNVIEQDIIVTFAPHPEEDADFDPAHL